jgi:hypothetical protein
MRKIIGHHTCNNTRNAEWIEQQGKPVALSVYNPNLRKNPFLGTGYYFWDDNIEQARYWGRQRCNNKYYIFEGDINNDESILLDLVSNRQQMRWLRTAMSNFAVYNNNNPHWEIGKFIEWLKKVSKKEGFEDIFPFKSVRAIDHNATIPKVEYYFDEKSEGFINLNPRIIVCIIEVSLLTLTNFKLIEER